MPHTFHPATFCKLWGSQFWPMSHTFHAGDILESWGGQFWLQPAFSRLSPGSQTRHASEEPPKKAAAGKIARPTIYAGALAGKVCGIGQFWL
jgi:hypothetical protein